MEKREFVKKVSAASLMATLGLTIDGCNPNSIPEPSPEEEEDNWPIRIDLTSAPYQPLLENQGWVLDDENKLLLLNIDDVIIALTSVCTHANCSKDWEFESNDAQFKCTCHNSIFDTNGDVIQGPATVPLQAFSVEREENLITIRK